MFYCHYLFLQSFIGLYYNTVSICHLILCLFISKVNDWRVLALFLVVPRATLVVPRATLVVPRATLVVPRATLVVLHLRKLDVKHPKANIYVFIFLTSSMSIGITSNRSPTMP